MNKSCAKCAINLNVNVNLQVKLHIINFSSIADYKETMDNG